MHSVECPVSSFVLAAIAVLVYSIVQIYKLSKCASCGKRWKFNGPLDSKECILVVSCNNATELLHKLQCPNTLMKTSNEVTL